MIPRLPLPAKIAIQVQDPIEVHGDDQAVHDKVLSSLQGGVDGLRRNDGSR